MVKNQYKKLKRTSKQLVNIKCEPLDKEVIETITLLHKAYLPKLRI
jgi:hypothetical protein